MSCEDRGKAKDWRHAVSVNGKWHVTFHQAKIVERDEPQVVDRVR